MNISLTQPGRFVVGCNYWASHAGTRMWSDWRPDIVEQDLKALAEGGLQVLRVFPLWPDFQPITLLRGGGGQPREIRAGEDPLPDTPAGQAGVSPVMIQHFQVFADLAEKYHLKLVVGLVTGWMSGRLYVPPALEGLDILTDPAAIQWATRFTRYFVRRFKNHPSVLAWDLGNEINCMQNVASRESAWVWVSAITNAIRVEDSTRVVVSGMHGWSEAWNTPMLGELTDLLTTHPYPFWTAHCDQDPVNTIRTILHSTAESRLYADTSGKPCLAEEVGTLGNMLASDEVAADFIHSCLYSLWAHDCHGLLWWCAFDQDLLAHAPYDWNTCERELGLLRSDFTPKPVLAELGNFRRWLEGLPFSSLPERTHQAVCLLSLDQDQWGAAYSAFVLARQAGFDLEFQLGEQPLKAAPVYLVPSVRGINVITRRRWLEVLERVRQGAVLYLSLDDALLSGFEETFGLRIQTRARRAAPARLSIDGLGAFEVQSGFRLDFLPRGAEILGREPDGNPAFTCYSYGQGKIYCLTVPIERALTETPGGFHAPEAQPFWKIYRQVAQQAMQARVARKTHPLLGITEHPLNEQERVIVAINYSPEVLEDSLVLQAGWQLGAVFHGEIGPGGELRIPANEAVVFSVSQPGEGLGA